MSVRRSSMDRPQTDYDLFRRALVLQDQTAWFELHDVYAEWTRGNVRARNIRDINDDPNLVQELANDGFYKFWHAYTAEKFLRSRGLAQVLTYLDSCVTCAILNWLRKNKIRRIVALDDDEEAKSSGEAVEVADPNAVDPLDQIQHVQHRALRQQVFDCLMAHCKNANETYIVHGLLMESRQLEEIYAAASERWTGNRTRFYQEWRNYKTRKFADGCAELLKEFWNDMP